MQGIVPLYYKMATAGVELINSDNIYEGLANAYTGGNIGMISNDITKIWNNSNPSLDVVKLLTMENNFVIDYAKTLYKPTRPKKVKKQILEYTQHKVPYFFTYAKDKSKHQVEKYNKSTVNKLQKVIPNPRIVFENTNVGSFDYKMLMRNKDIKIDINNKVIKLYDELDLRSRFMINDGSDNIQHLRNVYENIRDKFLDVTPDQHKIVDILIEYLYNHKPTSFKTTLWECFGDIIIENLNINIKQPLDDGWIMCDVCGKRVEYYNNRKYCDECQEEINRQKTKARMRKMRNYV